MSHRQNHSFPIRHKRLRAASADAFTLIELLLVLVILSVLAAIVLPKFTGRAEQGRIAAARTQIGSFKTVLSAYEVDMGHYPNDQEGLQALVQAPSNASKWHGPYLEMSSVPLDPWGKPYIYHFPGSHNPRGYDLSSAGPDGQEGTPDDIDNWTAQ